MNEAFLKGMNEAEWKTRKTRIDAKLCALNPPWQIISWRHLPSNRKSCGEWEGLFAVANQLEVRLAKARGQVDQLTPSLLARAFAGKLLPQDPTDEPAERLLERIHVKRVTSKTQV